MPSQAGHREVASNTGRRGDKSILPLEDLPQLNSTLTGAALESVRPLPAIFPKPASRLVSVPEIAFTSYFLNVIVFRSPPIRETL